MPIGSRVGDKIDSRYCGVETKFDDDVAQVLNFNIGGGFDFVLAPLVDPTYRPSLVTNDSGEAVLPFAGSDLVLTPAQWCRHVVGKISSWIDLDSEDETLRMDSEIVLKQEIACYSSVFAGFEPEFYYHFSNILPLLLNEKLYTSFIQPVTASKLYNDVKAHKDLVHFETAYVKMHNVAKLSPSQEMFTFSHPDHSVKKNNERYKKLRFDIPSDTGSAIVHGFAEYFDAVLSTLQRRSPWYRAIYSDTKHVQLVCNIFPAEEIDMRKTRRSLGSSILAVLWFYQGLV